MRLTWLRSASTSDALRSASLVTAAVTWFSFMLSETLAKGAALDTSLADAVALAMKEWALEKGATHYTHVFQPLTGLTAEKHDSFYSPPARARRWPSSPARS